MCLFWQGRPGAPLTPAFFASCPLQALCQSMLPEGMGGMGVLGSGSFTEEARKGLLLKLGL